MAKRVLIVDDSVTARMLIRRCVEIAGWMDADFSEAGNGREALAALAKNGADIVLTDLNMPEMDGEALLQAIRDIPMFEKLPVVVISSAGNEAKEEILRKAGASKILSKPISPPVIAEILESIFGAPDGN